MEFLFIRVVPKYFVCSTLSEDLLSIFVLWFCPAFWSRDMTMYLVSTAFISNPISLLATTEASFIYLYSMYASTQYINTINQTISLYVTSNFKPSWFTWILLTAYYAANLKSNGFKASLFFKPFLIGKMSDKCLRTQGMAVGYWMLGCCNYDRRLGSFLWTSHQTDRQFQVRLKEHSPAYQHN